MQPQLLFFDIDGTLLSNDTHQIPESALNAIAAAQKNGHLSIQGEHSEPCLPS